MEVPPPFLYRTITKPIVEKVVGEETLENLASRSVLSQAISMTKTYLPSGTGGLLSVLGIDHHAVEPPKSLEPSEVAKLTCASGP